MFVRPRADESLMHAAATQFSFEPRVRSDTEGASGELTAALAELEETTARVVALRLKVERLTAGLGERRQTLQGLERELASVRLSADHDRATISRLQGDVDERDELLEHLRTELAGLATELGLAPTLR